jgi:membrane associated rhomboid family serine protease
LIPIRDDNPTRLTPVVTRSLILVNVVLFVYELTLGRELRAFMFEWGMVPLRLTDAFTAGSEPLTLPAATLFTSTFLHGGWLHLIGNMWYLWIFGDNIEDRLGHARFLLFYVGAGIAAGLIHYLSAPASAVPTVGASGAIAAVLGGYLVTFPRARVMTVVPIFFFLQFVWLPAVLVLGLWFLFQFFSGALALGAGLGGGIAWWAHIGGFVFGAAVMRIGRRPPSRAIPDVWVE